MGELVYTFASPAARAAQGRACLDGMRRLADITRPRGVPVAWIASLNSAAIARAIRFMNFPEGK